MKINFENYEEYFLLYADNELTKAQRQIVEMFVKSNPQLQNEFNDILSTIQKPDDISIGDKTFLFRNPEHPFIDLNNYEQRFVEYHDDELSDAEKKEVEIFSLSATGLKDELELIGLARIEADKSIVYPEKENLYRRTSKVYYLKVLRIAVAAAFAGLIMWYGAGRFTEKQNAAGPVVASSVEEPATNHAAEERKGDVTEVTKGREDALTSHKDKPELNRSGGERQYANYSQKDIHPVPQVTKEGKAVNTVDNSIDINSVEPVGKVDVAQTDIPEIPRSEFRILAEKVPLAGEMASLSANKSNARYANYAEPDAHNDYVFYDIPAENLRQSKLGVFIKKVRRTIDRNNPINRLLNVEEAE